MFLGARRVLKGSNQMLALFSVFVTDVPCVRFNVGGGMAYVAYLHDQEC